jgi:hypothetical protein
MKRTFGLLCVLLFAAYMMMTWAAVARADVVLDWNAIAVNTAIASGQNPFAQARFAAIAQLAVFEAVNAITGDYHPYLGAIVAPRGASADAAAIAAAYRVLSLTSTERPQDRADVVRFFQVSSPTLVFNQAARQVANAQGRSMSENARALALINMAINDSLVASFLNKYHYDFWRPETAIRAGDTDGNSKTNSDLTFLAFIATPCFPSYPSNHASGSNGGAEVLRRLYGAGGHSITLSNPAVPDITLQYTTFKQITDDVDDARVYGGIHFRFDQVAGGRLGRAVATSVYKNNLRSVYGPK